MLGSLIQPGNPANQKTTDLKAKIDEFRKRRKGSTLGGLDWKELRDEGRR
jgi:hypothetical protein